MRISMRQEPALKLEQRQSAVPELKSTGARFLISLLLGAVALAIFAHAFISPHPDELRRISADALIIGMIALVIVAFAIIALMNPHGPLFKK